MGEYAKLLKKKAKDWACPDMMNTVANVGRRKLPFSSPQLNYVTYGGVPRAALSEFYGNEGGGKSTVAIDLCKNAKRIFEKGNNNDQLVKQNKKSKDVGTNLSKNIFMIKEKMKFYGFQDNKNKPKLLL